MERGFICRDFVPGDEFWLADLIEEVFNRFVAPDLPPDEKALFLESQQPRFIYFRFLFGKIFIIVAQDKAAAKKRLRHGIAGFIEVQNNNHISLLFVRKECQGRGVARRLINAAVKKCLAADPSLAGVTLNATPCARPIYERLGFEKTARPVGNPPGNSIPMVLRLNYSAAKKGGGLSVKELEFIYKRHSVRRFKEDGSAIPREHLEEIIRAATAAPSGKNLQNWHFVVVTDREKIKEITGIVERKNAALAEYLTDPGQVKTLQASLPYHTVFRGAPVLVLVYAGPYPVLGDELVKAGVMPATEAREYKKPEPGIQNIGAAMENLLLAAANLGYGGCWMTGPTYAAAEISAYIEFDKIVGKKDYFLAAMTPLGVPAAAEEAAPVPRGRKPLGEVLTFVE